MQRDVVDMDAERIFRDHKADHRILNAALSLVEKNHEYIIEYSTAASKPAKIEICIL